MAKAKNDKAKARFKGFLDFQPRPEHKESIRGNLLAPGDVFLWLEDTATAYNKVGVSYDDYHSTYHVTLQDKIKGSPNAGWVVNFRHGDLVVALTMARFFLQEVTEHATWEQYLKPDDEYNW